MFSKRLTCALSTLAFLLALAQPALAEDAPEGYADAVVLTLSDDAVLANGEAVPADDAGAAVYTAHDIVYYEAGHDFTYGEGTAADEHTADQAAAHTVVHIAAPGTYVLRGTLTQGQIAVDLGEDASEDPAAAVTLVLDGVNVTCQVAPAVIFYRVYECDQTQEQGYEPDLSAAGAKVVIADGSDNTVAGSYVARIYKSYTLNEAGTAVTDSKKLHKYDGAFYSRMSMTVSGGPEGTGVLNILAENEGLDTEMHLSIDGGNLRIVSGNDGINCNEDGVSVVTVNGGDTHITVTGQTGEGDGIDSNGWLVINSGTLIAQANADSADAGLDAENAIYLNGGMVIATGNMLDPLSPSDQCGALFSFARRQSGGTAYALVGPDGTALMDFTPENDFTYLLMTSPALEEGENYSLYAGEEQLSVTAAGGGGMGALIGGPDGGRRMDGMMPGGPDGTAPELPADGTAPELPTDGTAPEIPADGAVPEPPADGAAPEPPADGAAPEMPADGMAPEPPAQGQFPAQPERDGSGQGPELPADAAGEGQPLFSLAPGLNQFQVR